MKSASLLRKVTLGAAGVALLLCASHAAHPKNLRKLALHDLDGGKARLSDYQGRIVVLNFWATWCGPCKEELPRLAEMSQRYTGQQVAFILASIDEQKKLPAVRDYVEQQRITLPVWVGASVDLLEQLSGTNIVPATLIIDQNGEIVRVVNGEAREQDVKEAVDWLLGQSKGPKPSGRVRRY
jgi:thiol-disulfide isomerase/thioredoxin